MGDGHFSERPHKSQRDRGRSDVAENHGGAGELHGERAAEKESGANGATDRDHGELARGQIAMQAGFARQDGRRIGNMHVSGSFGLWHGAGIVTDRLRTANAPSAAKMARGWSLHESTAKGGQLNDPTLLYFEALFREPLLFTIADVAK